MLQFLATVARGPAQKVEVRLLLRAATLTDQGFVAAVLLLQI